MDKKQLKERIKKFTENRLKEMSTGAGATSGFQTGTGYQHQGKKPKIETKQKIFQKPPKDGKGIPSVFTPGAKDLSAYTSIGYREVKPSEMIDAKYLWAGKGGLKENITKIVDIDPNPMDDVPSIKVDLVNDPNSPDAFFKMSAMYHSGDNGKMKIFKNNPGLQKAVIALLQKEFQKIFRKVIHGTLGEPFGLNESRYSQFKKQTEVVKPSTQMQVAIREIRKRLQEVNKIASYTKQLKTELSETNNVSYNKRTEAYLGQLMKETATLYQNLKQIKENGKGKDKNIVS